MAKKKKIPSILKKILGIALPIILLFLVFSCEHPKQIIQLDYNNKTLDLDDVRICWRPWIDDKYSLIVLRNLTINRPDCAAIYYMPNNEFYLDGSQFFEDYLNKLFKTSKNEYKIELLPSPKYLKIKITNMSAPRRLQIRFSGD